ncbi:DNA (cytosine-5-)-methyltransferase [Clostridium sp. SYSU_GA19001]|uniref:DNA (cytosine-5-)-methyltransferase n=1 Tax=Clostridium caldaquaticum TaxID=2940653 RepID=UPI00207728DA|nr:DNA (cytosine-5-)-methyltransferase [Clostridium caldaquaticum]MCM8709928.1 DNA (cytosine-5-)-methyltransferase [Clostridium caldaquaticum]
MEELKISKEKVRYIMKQKDISTQTELAKRLGITKNQLSVLLSDKFDPIKSNVRLLCDTLGVNFMEIAELNECEEFERNKYYSAENSFINEELEKYDIYKPQYASDNDYVDIMNIVPKRRYNVLELFAGGGGLALGLEEAGFNTVGLVEVDKHCCNTLRINRPNWNVIEENIVTVVEKGIRNYIDKNIEIDVLSGGYPCQAFSYAGKKLGLEDVRGTMFYYYAEILRELKPKMFLAENVKGLVSHDGGKTLRTMLNVFMEIGYRVEYRVLNAMNYGVAQKRQRIIIVGIREDITGIKYKYPKPFDYIPTLRDALANVPNSIGAKYPETKRKVLELVPPGGYWKDLPDEIAMEYMGKSYYSGGGRTGMARRISWEEPCLTLTCSPAQKQTERCHPDETRPFTVREYARIQSFPDSWQFTGSMGEQYKQIGNAVPVKFAKAVGLSIINVLNQLD